MSITEPGLVHGMSDTDYHADPVPGGSLSSTFARLLTQHVPAKARELRKRPPTGAMTLGKAAHAHALGTGPELIVWQYDGRTKDGKAERAAHAEEIAADVVVAVTEDQYDQITGMAQVLRSDETVRAILDSTEHEVSAFWQEGDVWLRARYDLLGDTGVWDYKTCQDATRRGFSKSMGSYGYHQQADLYERGLAALGHLAAGTPMRFICQETAPPYLVQIHTPDDEARDVAQQLNDRAIRLYADCMASDQWPGFDQLEPDPAPLPAWYFFDNADVLPEMWRPTEEEITI